MKVYLADAAWLPDPADAPDLLGRLSEARRERVLRLKVPLKRREAFGAGLLLSEILPRYGADPNEIRLSERGKPLCDGVWFNLSHSCGQVALAVSEHGAVGCDLERVRAVPERLLSRWSEGEREEIASAEEGRERAFFRLWTAKESYLKMTGEGIAAIGEVEWREGRLLRNGREVGCTLTVFGTEYLDEYVLTTCGEESCEKPVCYLLG